MRCLIVVALLTTRAVVGRRNQFVLHELEESQRPLLLRRREVERVVASRRRLDAKRQREVERMDRTINGTALEAPCWGFDVRGCRSCLSYDEALAADAAFPPSDVGSVAFVAELSFSGCFNITTNENVIMDALSMAWMINLEYVEQKSSDLFVSTTSFIVPISTSSRLPYFSSSFFIVFLCFLVIIF